MAPVRVPTPPIAEPPHPQRVYAVTKVFLKEGRALVRGSLCLKIIYDHMDVYSRVWHIVKASPWYSLLHPKLILLVHKLSKSTRNLMFRTYQPPQGNNVVFANLSRLFERRGARAKDMRKVSSKVWLQLQPRLDLPHDPQPCHDYQHIQRGNCSHVSKTGALVGTSTSERDVSNFSKLPERWWQWASGWWRRG